MRVKGYVDQKYSAYFRTELPAHWLEKRLGYVSAHGRHAFVDGPFGSDLKTTDYQDDGVPLIQLNNIRDSKHVLQNMKFISEEKRDQLNRHIAKPNDVVFAKMADPVARSAIVANDFPEYVIVADCVKMTPDLGLVDLRYLVWAINSDCVRINAELVSTGTTRVRISLGDLQKLKIPYPPSDEQRAIARFLDHETAKIDALIEKQQRLIELLKEKRQAVISHAVTKGLNPNAPMKDSGVEWLGEVPAHWVVLKLGFLTKFKGGAGFPDSYQGQEEHEIPFYKVGDLARANLEARLTEPLHTITRFTAKELRATIFNAGAIVFAKVGAALLLKRFCVIDKPSCIDNNMMGAELSCIELRDFLLFLMPLLDFELIVNPGAVPSVNGEQISSILIALPPRDEQIEIVNFLKSSRIKFDHLVTSAEQAITLFQERRTALISAAVTGKIDVRDWQAAA